MSEPTRNNAAAPEMASGQPDEDEINLLDILIVLAEQKWVLLVCPLVAGVLAAGISLILPNIYTATTRILPPQSQSSASAMLAQQLGSLAGLASGAVGIKNPSDLYIGMLRSRTIADGVIGRFELQKAYQQNLQSGTRGILQKRSVITSGKDGIITIEVDDENPKRAADLANAYVEELFKFTRVIAVTEASQRRLFFERQFAEARDNLAAAEVAARQAMETGGLRQVEGQGRAIVEATARLRGQISVKEVQIGAMRTFAADRNPELRLAQQELEAMKRELVKLEAPAGTISANLPAEKGGKPSAMDLLRSVKYYETMYELLARQFELAKIDEARDSTVIQVIDKAIEPDRKSKPVRSMIVLLSMLAAAFVTLLFVFLRHGLRSASKDPGQAERLGRLKQSLRISRN